MIEAVEVLNDSQQSGNMSSPFDASGKISPESLERMLQHASYGAQMLEAAAAAYSPQPLQPQPQQPAKYPSQQPQSATQATSQQQATNSQHRQQQHTPMPHRPSSSSLSGANGPNRLHALTPSQTGSSHVSVAPGPPASAPVPEHTQQKASNTGPAASINAITNPSNSTGTAGGSGSAPAAPAPARKSKKEVIHPGQGQMELTIHQHNPDGTTTTISGGTTVKESGSSSANGAANGGKEGGGASSSKKAKHDGEGDGQTCLGCGATSTPEWRRGPLGEFPSLVRVRENFLLMLLPII